MEDAAGEEGTVPVRGRHIKKRALRNKSLSLSFNEKDLNDFVNGFHKRKKKRRREALQQQQEAGRRKLIELRKKRKMERDFVIYGGAPPPNTEDMDHVESDEAQDEDGKLGASVSGTTKYDNGEVEVTVTTSEIIRQEEYPVNKKPESENRQPMEVFQKSKQRMSESNGKKKQRNKGSKTSSQARSRGKRDKNKGKTKIKRH